MAWAFSALAQALLTSSDLAQLHHQLQLMGWASARQAGLRLPGQPTRETLLVTTASGLRLAVEVSCLTADGLPWRVTQLDDRWQPCPASGDLLTLLEHLRQQLELSGGAEAETVG